jgi:hypothetical protein
MVEITMNPVAYLAVCGMLACNWHQVAMWQDAATYPGPRCEACAKRQGAR